MKYEKWLFLAFSLVPIFTFGEIKSHLKSASGKLDFHKMENIDFIYMINLDQRPEKWEFCQRQLNPFGIFPYRFSAVNGWELSLEAINDVGLKFQKNMVGGYLGTSYKLEDNFELLSIMSFQTFLRHHQIVEGKTTHP